jgi:pimeloyl-ACP methyl ester carboxylesterase
MDDYDPRFGAAFYDGTWNKGFDHAEFLPKIACPTLLLHANYSYIDGDILDGAMDKQDAAKAMSLLKNGTYKRVDSTHVTNLDKPKEFVQTLESFFLGQTS